MIVPRRRLILLTALVLLPASILAGRFPQWTAGAVAAAVLWAVAVAIDAASGGGRFRGLRVAASPVVRMTVDREGGIPLEWQRPGGAGDMALRLGVVLPAALEPKEKELVARMPAGGERFLVTWACRALRRGRFPLTECVAELSTRWGLWAVRRRFPLDCEVRVYPNLTRGQTQLLGLFSRREQGWRTLRRVGKGREFEQLREYLPGDNYEDIDWKATARRRHPITRVFQVEQSQEIYVVLDASRLSTRSGPYLRDRRRSRRKDASPGSPPSVFERYVTAALVMALAADRASDRFGLLVFDSRPDCFIRAGRGRAHYNACREALYNRTARPVSPDFDELFTFIGTRVRKRALLVFLTHLDDPLLAEGFLGAMRIAGRRHVMMVNMLRPPGAWPLFSSPDVLEEAGIYEHLAGHMLWSSLSDTRRKLRQYGAGFALLDHEQLCSQLVGQYMDVKQRQIL
jgi:uncharacterized protein (DUF58 family)